MQTVDFDPPRSILTSSEWGDSYANRSERYLAAVAYLDGVHPSVVMTRGYYTYVYARHILGTAQTLKNNGFQLIHRQKKMAVQVVP